MKSTRTYIFLPYTTLCRSENLPWSKDEVTAERLTRLLQNKYPGIVVEHLNLDRFIDSHTSKMLVTVALNAVGKDAGIPEKLCIKSNFSGLHDEIDICAIAADRKSTSLNSSH